VRAVVSSCYVTVRCSVWCRHYELLCLVVFDCFVGARCCVWLLVFGYVSTVLAVVFICYVSERCCLFKCLVSARCFGWSTLVRCCVWLLWQCTLLCLVMLVLCLLLCLFVTLTNVTNKHKCLVSARCFVWCTLVRAVVSGCYGSARCCV